jgi:hypothetical protein
VSPTPPLDTPILVAEAREIYELTRGLVLADLRDDPDAMNAILTQLGITGNREVYFAVSLLAHAKIGMRNKSQRQKAIDALIMASLANAEQRL